MLLEVAGKRLDIFENLDERYVESIITLAHVLTIITLAHVLTIINLAHVLSKISNSYNWVHIEFIYNICDVLCDCYHMYKREKHPRRSDTFSKVAF